MAITEVFSSLAHDYARSRPYYPDHLLAYLAVLSPDQQAAWDVATGNGQAAVGLSRYFKRVIATDASFRQVQQAGPSESISYLANTAERSPLANRSVDLVTVAQAVHFFDLDAFYDEVRRVLRPGGLLAVWCYHLCQIEPQIDSVVKWYNDELLGPYWAAPIEHIRTRYHNLPFPFSFLELSTPVFRMEASWNLEQFVNFLGSWSARQVCIKTIGCDPLDMIFPLLRQAWGRDEEVRTIVWPLHFRIGRVME